MTYYVTKYLDTNNLPTLSYLVFGLYCVLILSAFYFHFQHRPKPQGNILKENAEDKPKQNKEDSKTKIFHNILTSVVKLASQHADSSPRKIGELIKESPQIVLAHLKEMENESLVVYVNSGKPPDIDTPFHIAYHENPWKYIELKPC